MDNENDYATKAYCRDLTGRTVAYIKFLMENDSREAELASLEAWRRAVGIFMLLFGCLSGAMFVTMLYLTAGPEPAAWRGLVFPSVLFVWVFFICLGTYVYLGWKVKRAKADNDAFVLQHTAAPSNTVSDNESEGEK